MTTFPASGLGTLTRDGTLATVSSDRTLRLLRPAAAAGEEMIRLQPLNPAYAPRTIPREAVAGLYAAVQVIKKIG